ncbi:peptidoglycan DD-metalloendopeptidase family protein [Caballeronia sp. LZ035]|uniref:peptidoglycan DD-metalloendopeptidase family protein n=1 Tax=Caballeronia sp. LZ035 TaxID=3038568 RepID=UPI002856B12C|nr:peptidoglycan DD-metalloendopeptidase family protein [Caballeronia sp. LZ035]MDR5756066.1 peptidoglycan DD-metalloendopeptidase family protein [Caballeronia sp. LZ035]
MRKQVVMHMEAFEVQAARGSDMHRSIVRTLLAAGMAAGLAACSSTPRTPAPIVESSVSSAPPVVQSAGAGVTSAPAVPLTAPAAAPLASLAPVEAGFYRVKPGDTLYGISRNFKQQPADLIAWNHLPESKQVNIGQVLRVAPPGSAMAAASSTASSSTAKSAQPPLLPTPDKAAAAKPAPSPAPATEHASTNSAPVGKGTFAWPAHGDVVRKFGASGNKGIDIEGKVGQPVKAAAAGKVVYAGSGLRSYGRMIIVKHGNDYLTAYAYNEKLLVKEGDTVKQGATIADMGTGPSGTPALHFEVRKAGAAIDPMPLLGSAGG